VHLFAAYLGGPVASGRMGEDHEIVFVVAADDVDAKKQAAAKWSGVGRGHVDAVRRIDQIDGQQVLLSPAPAEGDHTELHGYN
jgi:hypothetical protein